MKKNLMPPWMTTSTRRTLWPLFLSWFSFANTHAGEESSKAFLSALKEKIVSLSDVLGLIAEKKEEMLDADIEALIEERQAARKARNFARADEIRNELLSKGIVLEDTREGVKWKRA